MLLICGPRLRDKAHPLLMVIALALASTTVAQARTAFGVPIPAKARAEGEGRFQSPWDHQATVRWLERKLSRGKDRVRFVRVLDLPEVIASHADSPSHETAWSGVNVSRYGGSTWIFVIRRERSP